MGVQRGGQVQREMAGCVGDLLSWVHRESRKDEGRCCTTWRGLGSVQAGDRGGGDDGSEDTREQGGTWRVGGGGFTILVGDQRSAALLHIGQSTE